MTQRILVLGLDGYDPSIGLRLMEAGDLPNLRKLASNSAIIDLDHGEAKRTGLAWEHFATGLNPVDANRYSAVHFDKNTYKCFQTGTFLPPFTNQISQKVVVFDSPYFDISRSSNTTGLVGWGAHDPGVANISRPASLAKEVYKKFGDYPAKRWIYGHTWPWPELTRQSGAELVSATRRRAEIAKWMLTEKYGDWALAIIVASELHSATEALWHGVDDAHPLAALASADDARTALLDVYRALDDLIGELIGALPGAAVLAFNMHGMGANNADVPSMALLPELMYRRSFGRRLMQTETSPMRDGLIVPDQQEDWSDTMRRYFARRATENDGSGVLLKRSVSKMTGQARRLAKRIVTPILPSGRLKMPLNWMPAAWYQSYWSRMDAFAIPAFYDGQIRINLAKREAMGIVDPSDYASKLAELEILLSKCHNAKTGQPAVRDIIRSHRKQPLSLGPTEADLIVVWDETFDTIVHDDLGTIGPIPFRRPGGHTGGHGIAYCCGQNVAAGRRLARSAFDVAPTIMEWLGASQSAHISGESFLAKILS